MVLTELFARLGLDVDAQSFAKGALAADGIKAALAAVGRVAAAVTGQLRDMTLGVIDEAGKFADLSTKTGVAIQTLQELGYAGRFVDISVESLGQSLGILQRNMIGAVEGNEEMRTAFRRLGVDLVKDGKIRQTDEVFKDLADKFAKMPATAARSTAAMKIFGKSGAELLPLLTTGSEGLTKATEEFRALHGGFPDDFVLRADEFGDNVDRLKVAYEGVKSTVAQALLPALEDALGTTLEWVKANREVIRARVKEFVETLALRVRQFISAVRLWVKEHGGLSKVLATAASWLKAFAVILAGIKVAQAVQNIVALAASLKALGLTVTAATGALGVFALTAYAIVSNWRDVRDFFVLFWELMVEGVKGWASIFGDLISWVVKKIESLVEALADLNAAFNPFAEGRGASGGLKRVRRGESIGTGPALPVIERSPRASAINMSVAPTINVTQRDGESSEDFAKRVAVEVEKSSRRMLREATGGLF